MTENEYATAGTSSTDRFASANNPMNSVNSGQATNGAVNNGAVNNGAVNNSQPNPSQHQAIVHRPQDVYGQSAITVTSAINADYYNITNMEGWPTAGLLVLLDHVKQPVRAELQLYTELSQPIYESTVYQAYGLLQSKYTGH